MKKLIMLISTLFITTFIFSGCAAKTTNPQSVPHTLSNQNLTTIYNRTNNQYANVINSYADSIRDNKLETKATTQKAQQEFRHSQRTLQKKAFNQSAKDNLLQMIQSLQKINACYQQNNFTKIKTYQTQYQTADNKVRQALNISTENTKLTKAQQHLQTVAKLHQQTN